MFVSDSKYKSLQAACTRRLGSNVLRWPTDKQTYSHAQNGLEYTFKKAHQFPELSVSSVNCQRILVPSAFRMSSRGSLDCFVGHP